MTYVYRDLAFSSFSTYKLTIHIYVLHMSVCLDFTNAYAWMLDYILNGFCQNFHVLCFLLKVHFLLVAGLLEQEESTKVAEAKGLLKTSIFDLNFNTVGM